ncbi:alpha-sarcoglycan-like [Actinia tenebrosa]|uniref:Alpha-sarcoglycan-like n=1 Tax=Actinia tenebrosa TaxID=6105 RepID=A0A6P8JB19_ACTTE|nr:alpha-sarcoglycan-like [Actinia tenebrosa]
MATGLLLGVILGLIVGCSSSDVTKNCKVGVFFRFDVNKELLASDASHTAVKVTASTFGSPDLPKWLRIEQDTPEQPAVIYGTPPVSSPNNLTIEITGWDKVDYSTRRQNLTLLIDKTKGTPRYVAEFIIKNFDLDNFFFKLQPSVFKKKVKDTWKLDNIEVTKVESLLDRGGRFPIPPAKEGVFIAVGGNEEKMYNLIKADYLGNCSGLKPSVKQKFNPTNPTELWDIDWCKFRLLDTQAPVPTGNASVPPQSSFDDAIIQSPYSPPEMKPVPRDYGDLYVVVLILPVIIIIIIVIILAIIMCCFRQGKDKRDAATPRPQKDYHDSILRTTFQLRQMQPEQSGHENGGQTPRHESPTHTSTPYGRSNTSDDDSPRGAPPPYRMPPPPAVNVISTNGTNQFYPASR